MNAYERYRKKAIRRIPFDLNTNTDADILTWLDGQPNKAKALKTAIRAYMAGTGQAQTREEGQEPEPEPNPEPVKVTDRKYKVTYFTKRGGLKYHETEMYARNAKEAVSAFTETHRLIEDLDGGHAFRVRAELTGTE